tara:strand:+ start:101 stop:823 length:723 start_codon:yes stop_codon:yes gene_type:complete
MTFRTYKNISRLFLHASGLLLALNLQAMPMVYSGVDSAFATTESDAAFLQWSNSVGDFTLDNLDGLTGSPGIGGSLTSNKGNKFTSTDDMLGMQNFSFAVLEGTSLQMTKSTSANSDNVTSFTWDMIEAVDAFGFYARGNDGGVVTVALNDGSSQSFSLIAASSNSRGDNLFWGVSNLSSAVQSVKITSTDPVTANSNTNNSNWDRFVYSRAVEVSEPTSLALLLVGLMGIMFSRRQSQA